ncbi:MAG: ribonuclease P protein component [Desulfobacterales bacterium]|nr:ribonuclease P protein component [Desulfobacterales bacterium]
MFLGFQKKDRLLKRFEFIEVSNTGKKAGNLYFKAAYKPGKYQISRLGISVSKRVGNAVVRNRIKRLVREYFRLHRQALAHHYDIHIIAKIEAADLPTAQIFASLSRIFEKILEKNVD